MKDTCMTPGHLQAQYQPEGRERDLDSTATVLPYTRNNKPRHKTLKTQELQSPRAHTSPAIYKPGSCTLTSAQVSRRAPGKTKRSGGTRGVEDPKKKHSVLLRGRGISTATEVTRKPLSFFSPLLFFPPS